MSRTISFLLSAAMTLAAFSLQAQAQPPDDPNARVLNARLQLIEAEFEQRMSELQLKRAELAEDEATAELEKIDKLKTLSGAEAAVHVERDQAAIHVKMRAMEVEMARLRVERAKSRLTAIKASQDKVEPKPTAVRLEYDEGSEVVVIRGTKQGVEKLRALIERAEKQKQ